MKLLLILFVLFTTNVFSVETVVVSVNKAKLYNDSGRALLTINRGDVVQAIVHPKDKSYYMVKYKGVRYNALKKSFMSILDMVTHQKKLKLELAGKVKQNNFRLSAIRSELQQMYVKALELQRDTSISYRQVTSNLNGLASFGYRSMLSEGRLKKLLKEWSKDHAELIDEKKSLIQENLKVELHNDQIDRLLSSFNGMLEDSVSNQMNNRLKLYVHRSEGAKLYQDSKVVKYIAQHEVLQGKVDTKHEGWFKVLYEGKVFRVSGNEIFEVNEYHDQILNKMVTTKYDVNYLNEEIEFQQFRLKLYKGIAIQLESDKFVAGGYGLVKNYVIPITKDFSLTLESPDADTLFINSNRANRILRIWAKEANDLSVQSLKYQRRVIDMKKSLIDYENSLKELAPLLK
ncbi:MAG: hypothetical protein NE334_18705 [Lentisphaeraceae bacterium]|nr:hypothetical protein [Lentisphaeraceae bacterium]